MKTKLSKIAQDLELEEDQKQATIIKELYKALENLLQACDDEGWINDDTGEDWEEQKEARKALKNTPNKYLK